MPPTDNNNNDDPHLRIGAAFRHLLEQRMARQESGVAFIKNCCKLLLNYGVKQVTFEYDGSGDSGDMDYIWLAVTPSQTEVAERIAEVSSPSNEVVANATATKTVRWEEFVAERKKEKNPLITPEMCDQLVDEAFSLLPGGWEINDGSYGTVIVETANETIEVEHNERYTEVRTENFTY